MSGSGVLEIVLSWIVTTAMTFLVVVVDERRMGEEALERAWPPQSRDAAIVAFGPLAVIVHFMKTRGHLGSARGVLGLARGLMTGIAAAALVLVASGLLLEALSRVLPPSGEAPSDPAKAALETLDVDVATPAETADPAANAVSLEAAEVDEPIALRARTYNVVLVTVDTLRFDLGFMGYPRPVSPNIDAFAARSVVYERAYATASYTPKSLGPLLLGRYASEAFRDGEHYTTFYPANVFVAERVRAAGGRTLAAMAHHYFRWKTGFDQGFDVWDLEAVPVKSVDNDPTVTGAALTDVALALLGSPRASEIPVDARPLAESSADAAPTPLTDAAATPLTDAAATPLTDAAPDGRFFAWFHYLDPHAPYVPHEGAPDFAADDAGTRARAAYDGEVWFTDGEIGRLLDHVAAQPWAAETAILLTADHGEAFGERGHYKHGRELWEPLVRVPFVLFVPGLSPRRIEVKRSHIDVVPTILELMGIVAEEGALRGASLLADALSDAPEERDVYMDMPEGPFNELRRAVITGPTPGLKLIDFGDGREELFDLAADPGETRNIASDRARRREAEAAMARARARLQEQPPSR